LQVVDLLTAAAVTFFKRKKDNKVTSYCRDGMKTITILKTTRYHDLLPHCHFTAVRLPAATAELPPLYIGGRQFGSKCRQQGQWRGKRNILFQPTNMKFNPVYTATITAGFLAGLPGAPLHAIPCPAARAKPEKGGPHHA
jgi:hypothetical protein